MQIVLPKIAVFFEEDKTHNGRKEIEQWIADSNERYKATIKPVSFEEKETESLLMVETSGNFDKYFEKYQKYKYKYLIEKNNNSNKKN